MTARTLRIWFLVHKWTSLIATVFLLLLCLTGLPLIFHEEIEHYFEPPPPLRPLSFFFNFRGNRVISTIHIVGIGCLL